MVSEKVTRGLQLQFSRKERDRMQTDVPLNPLAYEYYLRSLSYPLSTAGDSLAIVLLKNSIRLDSTYAPAFAEIGYRVRRLHHIYSLGGREVFGKEESYFLKALSLNGELLSALNHLVGLYTDIGRPEKALALARRALRINPNNAYTHYRLSYIYRYAGMLNESEREVEEALRLFPNNPRFSSVRKTYLYLGKYSKALEACDFNKESVNALATKGEIFYRDGQKERALEWFNKLLDQEPPGTKRQLVASMKAYLEGNKEEALRITLEWEQANPYDSEVLYNIANNYGLFGDKAGCVRVLRKAVEGGFFNYPFMLRDPFLDSARDDPEFQRVLALAEAKHEAFKKKFF